MTTHERFVTPLIVSNPIAPGASVPAASSGVSCTLQPCPKNSSPYADAVPTFLTAIDSLTDRNSVGVQGSDSISTRGRSLKRNHKSTMTPMAAMTAAATPTIVQNSPQGSADVGSVMRLSVLAVA